MVEISAILDQLLKYWQTELKAIPPGKSAAEITSFEKRLGVRLPLEFHQYFNKVNGMEPLYPNYADSEGFLFYPLEELIFHEDEFTEYSYSELNTALIGKKCLIFANYMHKSWWYGLLLDPVSDKYSIVLIDTHISYRVIASSLSDFISMYLEDPFSIY